MIYVEQVTFPSNAMSYSGWD